MKAFRKPLTKEEEALILTKVRSGDSAARSTLIEANMRLVAHISKKYSAPTRNSEDLISMGTIGLIKACNSFDYEKKQPFCHLCRQMYRERDPYDVAPGEEMLQGDIHI